MTDHRVLECAKALRTKAREIGLPVALTADQASDLARACVLKWLQYEGTDKMRDAATALDLLGIDADTAWDAMRGQAAKEIG